MSQSRLSWSPEPSLGDSDDGKRGIGIVHGGHDVYDLFAEERVSPTPSPRVVRKEAGKRLGEGEIRRLVGLVRRDDLNGLRSVVEKNHRDTGKCIVSLPSQEDKNIRVQYENLAVESPSPSPDRGPPGPFGMFVSPSPEAADDDGAGDEEQGGGGESSASPLEPIRQAANDGCFVVTFPPNPSVPRSRTVPHQIGVACDIALAPPARWRFRINICLFRIQYCKPFLLQYACSLVLYRLLLPWHVQESNMGQQAPAVFLSRRCHQGRPGGLECG